MGLQRLGGPLDNDRQNAFGGACTSCLGPRQRGSPRLNVGIPGTDQRYIVFNNTNRGNARFYNLKYLLFNAHRIPLRLRNSCPTLRTEPAFLNSDTYWAPA